MLNAAGYASGDSIVGRCKLVLRQCYNVALLSMRLTHAITSKCSGTRRVGDKDESWSFDDGRLVRPHSHPPALC